MSRAETWSVMDPAFVMTQAEADAVFALQWGPLVEERHELCAKVGIFVTVYQDVAKAAPRPSEKMDTLMTEHMVTGDTALAARMPYFIGVVEAMFARAKFNCERVD